jgi:hypothetical protein
MKGMQSMTVYKAEDMQATPDIKNPNMKMIQFGGDLIKVGIVTYQEGEGPPPITTPMTSSSFTCLRAAPCI